MKGSFTVNELSTPHGHNRWRVEGKVNGKRIRAFYPTREAASEAARLRNIELENNGHHHTNIPGYLRVEALRCAQRLSVIPEASLSDAVDFYLAHHDVRAKSLPVYEACERFIADSARRLASEEIGSRHHSALVKTMRKFVEAFGPEHICDLQSAQIETWLNSLPLALESKNHHRRSINRLFTQAKKWGWVKTNPVAEVDILSDRKTRTKLPGIFSVEQAAALLETADSEILPVIAIGLFAGLRPAEIHKLTFENIFWEKRLVDVSAKISKTASRRFVKMSDNLLEWLAPYRNASGSIFAGCEGRMIRAVTDTGRTAGIAKWPQDGLRHSFGSYHLAAHEDAAQTALQMGHMTTKMVFAHYNNRRSQEEALAYWNIRPSHATNITAIAAA